MPYKRRHPVDEREMLKERWAGHHTVCETLREIYRHARTIEHACGFHELNEAIPREHAQNIQQEARLAMAMAKAMQEKLKQYKAQMEVIKNERK